MIKKIKLALVSLAMLLGVSAPALLPVTAYAAQADNAITAGLCNGSNAAAGQGTTNATAGAAGCTAGGNDNSDLKALAAKVVNLISLLVGIVAIIMIIYGGFRYITSGGSSEKIGSAKNTLIYAIIGLIIVALSQFIVHYVLTASTNAVS